MFTLRHGRYYFQLDTAGGLKGTPTRPEGPGEKVRWMDKIHAVLGQAMRVHGVLGAAVVDFHRRMVLGAIDRGTGIDMDKVAYGDSDVVRAKLYTLELLGYSTDSVEDILITLPEELHMIRPLPRRREGGLFVYLVLDRARVDLDVVRRELHEFEEQLKL